jgi:hypothetical protein
VRTWACFEPGLLNVETAVGRGVTGTCGVAVAFGMETTGSVVEDAVWAAAGTIEASRMPAAMRAVRMIPFFFPISGKPPSADR